LRELQALGGGTLNSSKHNEFINGVLEKPELIGRIEQRSFSEGRAHAVSAETGRLLQIIVKLLKARHILEIGFGFGASTIYLAAAMGKYGHIDSIEFCHEHAVIGKHYISQATIAHQVNVLEDDALNILPKIEGQYDLIFLDADPSIYCACLLDIVRVIREGGIIVTENIWSEETAFQLVGKEGFKHIRNYVTMIFADRRLYNTILNESMIISFKESQSV